MMDRGLMVGCVPWRRGPESRFLAPVSRGGKVSVQPASGAGRFCTRAIGRHERARSKGGLNHDLEDYQRGQAALRFTGRLVPG